MGQFSVGGNSGVPTNGGAAVRGAHGASQLELRELEDAQGGGCGPQDHLQRLNRRRRPCAAGGVRGPVGSRLPDHCEIVAQQLAADRAVL